MKKIITKIEKKEDNVGNKLCDIKLKTIESDSDSTKTLNAHRTEPFFIEYFIQIKSFLEVKSNFSQKLSKFIFNFAKCKTAFGKQFRSSSIYYFSTIFIIYFFFLISKIFDNSKIFVYFFYLIFDYCFKFT